MNCEDDDDKPLYRRQREQQEDEIWEDIKGCRGAVFALLFLLCVGIAAGVMIALAAALFSR